jgi:hypothetical protein
VAHCEGNEADSGVGERDEWITKWDSAVSHRSDDVSGDIIDFVYKQSPWRGCSLQFSLLIHNGRSFLFLLGRCALISSSQGSVVSAIGRGIESIIMAIASVVMAIVGAITTVRPSSLQLLCRAPLTRPIQVIVTIFDLITDILCCRCCGDRRTSSRRRGWGRSRW